MNSRHDTISNGVNLLPRTTKRFFATQYYFTLTTVFVSLLSLVIILGGALLIPSYFLARAEAESAERYLSALEETVGLRERAGVSETMRRLSERVGILSSFENGRPTADIMVEIDRHLPSRVFLQGVSVTHSGSRAGEVTLVGIADSRADLLSFSDALKSSSLFNSVAVPVNQLVSETDVKFSFTFRFNQDTP